MAGLLSYLGSQGSLSAMASGAQRIADISANLQLKMGELAAKPYQEQADLQKQLTLEDIRAQRAREGRKLERADALAETEATRAQMASRMQERIRAISEKLAKPMVETAEGTQQLDRLMPVTNSEAQMSAYEQALMEGRNDEAAQHKAIGLLNYEEQKRAAELEKARREAKGIPGQRYSATAQGFVDQMEEDPSKAFIRTDTGVRTVNQNGGGGGSGGSSKTKLPAGAKPYGDGYYLEVATSGLIEGPDGKPLKSKKKEFYTMDGRPTTASVLLGNQAQSSGSKTSGTIPSGAISHLRSNPKLADKFDEKYGKGAAARVLNMR